MFQQRVYVCCYWYPSGADCTTDGGRLSAPGFLLMWTESVGPAHTFPPDQVCVCACVKFVSVCLCMSILVRTNLRTFLNWEYFFHCILTSSQVCLRGKTLGLGCDK